MMKLSGKTVWLTGKFEVGGKELVQMRAKAQGATLAYERSSYFDCLLVGTSPTKSDLAAAEKRGAEQLGHDEVCALLSGPLHAYAERFRQSVEGVEGQKKYQVMIFKHLGAPASAAAIAAAEEKLGVALDPALRRFYEEMNGVTIGYRKPFRPEIKEGVELADGGGPYPLHLFMGSAPDAGLLWRCPKGKSPGEVGTLNIPPIEALFASSWGDLMGMSEESVSFGKKSKLKGSDLFLLDATYGYQPIYLGVDRAKRTMRVAVGHDHAACFSDFPEVDVETYLEDFVHGSHLSLHTRQFGDYRVGAWWT